MDLDLWAIVISEDGSIDRAAAAIYNDFKAAVRHADAINKRNDLLFSNSIILACVLRVTGPVLSAYGDTPIKE